MISDGDRAASRILGQGGQIEMKGGESPPALCAAYACTKAKLGGPGAKFGLRSLLAQFQLNIVIEYAAYAAACRFDRASYYLNEIVDLWSRKCRSFITKLTTYQLLCAHP